MIWALIAAAIAAAIASGGGPDRFEQVIAQWKRAVKKVDDDARRQAASKTLDRLEGVLAGLNDSVRRHMAELDPVHARYESTLADYQAIIDDFGPELLASQMEMVDTAVELRNVLGPEQHAKAFKSVHERLQRQQKRIDKRAARRAQKRQRDADKRVAGRTSGRLGCNAGVPGVVGDR